MKYFTNHNTNNNFEMKLFKFIVFTLLVTILFSCTKNNNISSPQINHDSSYILTQDSFFILTSVTDAGGLTLKFDYDATNKRLSSWSKTYSSYNYDSTKVFYDGNGKVLSLVGKNTTSTPFNVIPNVFEYDSQNRVSKVYHKFQYSTNESYAYMTSVTFPLDYYREIESYDSLNYDILNRVISVYNFSTQFDQTNTAYTVNDSYKLITYLTSNDSLPDQIKTYTRNSSGGFSEAILNLSTYNNKVNPYYNLFKKFSLMGVDNFSRITTPTFLPYYYYGYKSNADLTGIPYLSTNLGLTYTYNADSLVSQCIKGQDATSWVRFAYRKLKK